MTGMVEKYN